MADSVKSIDGLEIAFVSPNENGDWYVGFKVPVTRGIRGKTKGKVDELLIIGIPKDQFGSWLANHGLCVGRVLDDGSTESLEFDGIEERKSE